MKLKHPNLQIYIPSKFCIHIELSAFFALALATGDPNARVPYGSIQASQVVGFPPNIDFKPPSHFGVCNLKLILENADHISFRGTYVHTYVHVLYM